MRRFAKKMARESGREESLEFTKTYFKSLINGWCKCQVGDSAMDRFLEDTDYMSFPIIFANDTCIILDAGIKMYIEWGSRECSVYVDIDNEYTYIGRVRNSRFWALADRVRNKE